MKDCFYFYKVYVVWKCKFVFLDGFYVVCKGKFDFVGRIYVV